MNGAEHLPRTERAETAYTCAKTRYFELPWLPATDFKIRQHLIFYSLVLELLIHLRLVDDVILRIICSVPRTKITFTLPYSKFAILGRSIQASFLQSKHFEKPFKELSLSEIATYRIRVRYSGCKNDQHIHVCCFVFQ